MSLHSTSVSTHTAGAIDARASLQRAGRVLLAMLFVGSGLHKALAFDSVAGWMAGLGLPWSTPALAATIVLEVVAGLALAFGRPWPVRIAAVVLAVFVAVASVVFHAFWSVPADQFGDQLTHFLKNGAIVGGLLLIAGASRCEA